jgi:uncharacterized protein involved in exopolysaccharide biosynthesis
MMARRTNNRYDDDGIDISVFFALIYRYRFFVLIFTVCSSLAVLLFVYLMAIIPPQYSMLPDTYRAYATILVSEESPNDLLSALVFPSSARTKAGISLSNYSNGELAVKLIKSKTILDTISHEFNIAERHRIKRGEVSMARGYLLSHLKITYDDKTNTIVIAYEDYEAAFASRLVNRIIDELRTKFSNLNADQNIVEKSMLETKISDVKSSIDTLETQIKIFQKKYGFLTIESFAEEQTVTIARLKSQLIDKEMEIKTKQELSNIEDPEIRILLAERDNLRNLIDGLESGYASDKKLPAAQKDLPDVAQAFSHLQRSLAIQVKIYEILIQQNELLRLSLPAVTPMFQVIDRAEVPDMKFGPTRSIVCIAGAIVSFFMSIFIVVMYYAIKEMAKKIIAKEKQSS